MYFKNANAFIEYLFLLKIKKLKDKHYWDGKNSKISLTDKTNLNKEKLPYAFLLLINIS